MDHCTSYLGDNWDNHTDIVNELPKVAVATDKPMAALLQDLEACGLLADTLVIWTTEFGRMTFTQGKVGRDHNGGTFVSWFAGAGIRPGTAVGQSDEWSWTAMEGVTTNHDFHATILHLLGLNHERVSVRHCGVDRRLTDVHGRVIHEILESFLTKYSGAKLQGAGLEELEAALMAQARPALKEVRPSGIPDLLWEIECAGLEHLLRAWVEFEKGRALEGLLPAGAKIAIAEPGPREGAYSTWISAMRHHPSGSRAPGRRLNPWRTPPTRSFEKAWSGEGSAFSTIWPAMVTSRS